MAARKRAETAANGRKIALRRPNLGALRDFRVHRIGCDPFYSGEGWNCIRVSVSTASLGCEAQGMFITVVHQAEFSLRRKSQLNQ